KRRLAGHFALRDRAFLDAEDRHAGCAIEDVHEPRFRRQRKRRNRAAVPREVEESGRRRWIMIPEIVMNRLEVPAVPAGQRVDGEDGVAVQVRAFAIAAVKVVDRRREWHVEQTCPFIEREKERPRIDTKSILPAITLPGLVPRRTRLRDRAELP